MRSKNLDPVRDLDPSLSDGSSNCADSADHTDAEEGGDEGADNSSLELVHNESNLVGGVIIAPVILAKAKFYMRCRPKHRGPVND